MCGAQDRRPCGSCFGSAAGSVIHLLSRVDVDSLRRAFELGSDDNLTAVVVAWQTSDKVL